MKLYSINTGFFKLDGGAMFGVVPKTIWHKLNPPDADNLCTWALRCLLVEEQGRLVLIDTGIGDFETLARLEGEGRVVFRYADDTNPNAAMNDIAGIVSENGNVIGMMPHPENHVFPWQHPRAHRGERGMLGLRLFENGIRNA